VLVEPVDPAGAAVFHLVDRSPRLAWLDQLGFVQAVNGLG
jgi:hypothetical protein